MREIIAEEPMEGEEAPEESGGKALSINPEIAEKARSNLSRKKYKSKLTDRQISFSTAYNRGDDRAVSDFREEYAKELEKDRADKKPFSKKQDPSPSGGGIFDGEESPASSTEVSPTDEESSDIGDSPSSEANPINPLEGVKDSDRGYLREKDPEVAMAERGQFLSKSVDAYFSLDRAGRKEAITNLEEAVRQSKPNTEEKLLLKDRLAAATAAAIIAGDDGIPEKADPNLIAFAQTSKGALRDNAIMAIADSLSPNLSRNRQSQVSFFNSLDYDDWKNAVGGEDGPFGEILKTMNPNFCPDHPDNGENGGQVVGDISACPVHFDEQDREDMRAHITQMMVDGITITKSENSPKDGDSPSGESKDKSKSRKDTTPDYLQALIDGDEEKAKRIKMNQRVMNLYEKNRNTNDPVLKAHLESLRDAAGDGDLEAFERALVPILPDESLTDRQRLLTAKVARRYFNKSFIQGRKYLGRASIMRKQSTVYVDYQSRARAFEIGMRVYPFFGGKNDKAGVVRAVYPAIGMVDVQFPHGSSRYPVEELVVDTSGDYENISKDPDSVPGGAGSLPVSSGSDKRAMRVASSHMKRQAIYWAQRDRKYRQKRTEAQPHCPRCPDTPLRKTTYQRREGVSHRLLGCSTCLFLIHQDDLI